PGTHAAALDHPQGRAVGGGQGGELVVVQRRVGDVVHAGGGGRDVLGVAAVPLAAHEAHGIRVRSVPVVHRGVHHDPDAHQLRRAPFAEGDHGAGDVGALDAG